VRLGNHHLHPQAKPRRSNQPQQHLRSPQHQILFFFGKPAPSVTNSESAATPSSPGVKRKATDPNLKVVTIDPFYDLTLIVGSPGSFEPQTAFQVNKGTLRHASEVWTKMLTGPWYA
jgi:hypothetical protein